PAPVGALARTRVRMPDCARVEEQRQWSDLTDADRLEKAFAGLDERGITAREHFTCCRQSAQTTTAVGREVAAALGEAGLTVEWDGSPDRAIELTGLDWRKRLVG
ncbi:DUF6891 domain-containing protein, partial [Streptomyces sp. NPDC058409]|uniref:DUF6891 domain-containing protein n=1 Tax=Streptomyces sp. NPDC058409 TaxID=3346484 RepID=UPI003646CE84